MYVAKVQAFNSRAYVVLSNNIMLPADGGEDRNGWRGGSGRKRSKRRHRRRWLTEVVVVGAYIRHNKGQRAAEISHLRPSSPSPNPSSSPSTTCASPTLHSQRRTEPVSVSHHNCMTGEVCLFHLCCQRARACRLTELNHTSQRSTQHRRCLCSTRSRTSPTSPRRRRASARS